MIRATIGMPLEDTMLYEIRESQKDKYCLNPHLTGVLKFIKRGS